MKALAYTLIGLVAILVLGTLGCWSAAVWTGDNRWNETAGIGLTAAVTAIFGFVFTQIGRSE